MPYYTLFRNDITGVEEFVMLRPFVPFSTNDERTELQAYMTASSDPETYGQLIAYVVDQPTLPAGPARVADQAESEQAISRELSLQSNQETQTSVSFGDLQLCFQPVSRHDGVGIGVGQPHVVRWMQRSYRIDAVDHIRLVTGRRTTDA